MGTEKTNKESVKAPKAFNGSPTGRFASLASVGSTALRPCWLFGGPRSVCARPGGRLHARRASTRAPDAPA